jgi:hypothetical protein
VDNQLLYWSPFADIMKLVHDRKISLVVYEACGDLCGDEVDCRVWIYQGKEYTEPPKAMIIEGILKAGYGGDLGINVADQESVLPENLKHFYEVMESKK